MPEHVVAELGDARGDGVVRRYGAVRVHLYRSVGILRQRPQLLARQLSREVIEVGRYPISRYFGDQLPVDVKGIARNESRRQAGRCRRGPAPYPIVRGHLTESVISLTLTALLQCAVGYREQIQNVRLPSGGIVGKATQDRQGHCLPVTQSHVDVLRLPDDASRVNHLSVGDGLIGIRRTDQVSSIVIALTG